MEIQELLHSLVDRAGARTIYGEPITAEGKTVLPVARIRYGFGGGSGKDQSFGGGGGFHGRPVGVVEITRETTRFIPIVENRKIALAVGIGICLGLLIARKRVRVIQVEKKSA